MKKVIFAAAMALAAPAFAGSPEAPVMEPEIVAAASAESSIGGSPTVVIVTLAVLLASLD